MKKQQTYRKSIRLIAVFMLCFCLSCGYIAVHAAEYKPWDDSSITPQYTDYSGQAEVSNSSYNFASLFSYNNTYAERSPSARKEGTWYGVMRPLWGVSNWDSAIKLNSVFKILSVNTGNSAEFSGARFNGALSGSFAMEFNALPKLNQPGSVVDESHAGGGYTDNSPNGFSTSADTKDDYAFRKLTVRIFDVKDPTDYVDVVYHNIHNTGPADQIYPTSSAETAQASLVYAVDKEGNCLSEGAPNNGYMLNGKPVYFGQGAGGSFCGIIVGAENMKLRYDRATKKIQTSNGGGGWNNSADLSGEGKFNPEYYGFEFIFEGIQPLYRGGVAVSAINAQDWGMNGSTGLELDYSSGKVLTNDNNSTLSDKTVPKIISSSALLGTSDDNVYAANQTLTLENDILEVADAEQGYAQVPFSDDSVSLYYRPAAGGGDVAFTGLAATIPDVRNDTEYYVFAEYNNGKLSAKKQIGGFKIGPDSVRPVIKLNGAKEMFIDVKDISVTDPGATVTDNVDTDLVASSDWESVINYNITGGYVVTYTAIDTALNTATTKRIVTVVDRTAPIVTLAGDAIVTVALGGTFTDTGATATDNFDAAASLSVSVQGSVNTAKIGTYTLSYICTDAGGNTGSVQRTVKVVDAEKPVIMLEHVPTAADDSGVVTLPIITVTDNSGETIVPYIVIKDSEGNLVDFTDGVFIVRSTGTHTVTITATDSSSNQSEASFTLTAEAGSTTTDEKNCGKNCKNKNNAAVAVSMLLAVGGALLLRRRG